MATAAGTEDFNMVYAIGGHRRPGRGQFVMTSFTLVGSIQMGQGFAAGLHPIVATYAITGKRRMVNQICRHPGVNGMAVVALRIGGKMRG